MTAVRQNQVPEGRLRNQLLRQRHLLKDVNGRVVETIDGMFGRAAEAVAEVESHHGASANAVQQAARRFHDLMSEGLFLPNSPTLMNAGRTNGMLSACFVVGIEDSIEGIFEAVTRTALIQKAGGGTGFAFDALRPTGDLVASSGGVTSGPISFWRIFAETTNAIQQGAQRRGANMGMMSIEHLDVLNFITAKQEPGAFGNFNISVKITDAYMAALSSTPDAPHVVTNQRTKRRYLLPSDLDLGQYGLDDLVPADQTGTPCYGLKDVWDLIVSNARATGEPGVCFIDRVNRDNPTPALGRIEATNPCGEQPLLPGEACNLGSINVTRFVLADGTDVDWNALGETVALAVRFLDDAVEANHYPVPEIAERTKANRKIGLGMMGLADALILLGLRYDSDEAVEFARRLSRFIQERAHEASHDLAEQRGNFPNWPGSIWDTTDHQPMRNASCTTVAPTGSISIIAGCSAGIEPIYRLGYRRRALDGQEFVEIHPLLEEIGEREGWMTSAVREALLKGGPASAVPGIPLRWAETLVTAHDVCPDVHVWMQAAIQEHTDSAVSKTVNLPGNASVADVDRVFRLAYRLGCKGITVYRDGSREGQTLNRAARSPQPAKTPGTEPRPRVRVTGGRTFKYRMGCGTLFVTVNRDDSGLCEVFANLGKAGGCPSQSEATCRAVSVALRSGVSPETLIEQLKGIRCLSTSVARRDNDDVTVLSCPDAIARAIEESLSRATVGPGPAPTGRMCPTCGHRMRREAGCFVCDRCGFSRCS